MTDENKQKWDEHKKKIKELETEKKEEDSKYDGHSDNNAEKKE